jgi:hypothetical protein
VNQEPQTAKHDTVAQTKLLFFNELARKSSSGARTGFGTGNAFRAKIPVQCIDSRVQNQVAVGASFQMALNLDFDGLGEPPL